MSPTPSVRHAPERAPKQPRARRVRRRTWALVVLVVLALVAALAAWVWTRGGPEGEPTVTASSTQAGSSVRAAVDTGSASSLGADWQSDRETAGAWLELSWQRPHMFRKVVIVRNAVDQPGVTDGFLTFGDGSYLQVRLSPTSRATVVPITPRSVDRIRFTASAVSAGAHNVTISEFVGSDARGDDEVVADDAPGGNEAAVASATVSPGAPDPRPLLDGSGGAGTEGAGADWVVEQPQGAWVQLDWQHPQELSSVQVVGSPRSSASLRSATLTFGDGTTIPIGAVLASTDRPTVVSFMPRVTRSVRLSVDAINGGGALALGELRVYRQGATPVRTPSTATSPPEPGTAPCADTDGARPATGLVVTCPTTGAVVDGNVIVQVAVAEVYSAATATVWPGDAVAPAHDDVPMALDGAGTATAVLDVSDLQPGPFTVKLTATGGLSSPASVYFQLYRSSTGPSVDVASSAGARGRRLVYAEEFNQLLSISRNGLDADYAAAKPVVKGVEDFGDAIFADPAQGAGGPRVVDNSFLRIDVDPLPAGFTDPQNWGRTHTGGLLASARPGGSGFSAQYGYFEARMLLPAAPGTWPAFWTLPSDNLVAPQPAVAEIDALEHYGHNPVGACETTHEFVHGRDGGVVQCGQRFATDRDALSWHTYGVSVTPTEITFLIDGQVVATAPQVRGGASPMFFLVNLALGGGWPIDLTAVGDRAVMYVDYIRVYV